MLIFVEVEATSGKKCPVDRCVDSLLLSVLLVSRFACCLPERILLNQNAKSINCNS